MTSRIDPLKPGDAEDETTNEILRDATEVYDDSAYFGAIAHKPELFKHLIRLFEPFPDSENLSPNLLEVARLGVANANGCAYCATVRDTTVEDQVADKEQAIFGDGDPARLSEKEQLALDLAEQLSTEPHKITDEFVAELKETFGEKAFLELLLFVSLEIGMDRFTIALELTPTEKSPYRSDIGYPFE